MRWMNNRDGTSDIQNNRHATPDDKMMIYEWEGFTCCSQLSNSCHDGIRQTTVQALMLLGKLSSLRKGWDGIRPNYAIKLQMAVMEYGPCYFLPLMILGRVMPLAA